MLNLSVVGWGPGDGCWWHAGVVIVQVCRRRAVGPLSGWSCQGLRIGGSVQMRGEWVPRWMMVDDAEAEGGLLLGCRWLLVLEGGWP